MRWVHDICTACTQLDNNMNKWHIHKTNKTRLELNSSGATDILNVHYHTWLHVVLPLTIFLVESKISVLAGICINKVRGECDETKENSPHIILWFREKFNSVNVSSPVTYPCLLKDYQFGGITWVDQWGVRHVMSVFMT